MVAVNKVAIVLGTKERYVFTLEEFKSRGLLINGPRQLWSWEISSYNPNFLYNRLSPFDEEVQQACKDAGQPYNYNKEYGCLMNIFRAIENLELDWDTEVCATFYLDDEDSASKNPYTWRDNFDAEEWWWQEAKPNRRRTPMINLMRLVGVES